MPCIIQTDSGYIRFYNNYLYDYICNGEIINNICQDECVQYLIINNLIIVIILTILVVALILFTVLMIVKPDIFCCNCRLFWKEAEYLPDGDDFYPNNMSITDSLNHDIGSNKYSIV